MSQASTPSLVEKKVKESSHFQQCLKGVGPFWCSESSPPVRICTRNRLSQVSVGDPRTFLPKGENNNVVTMLLLAGKFALVNVLVSH